MLSPTLGRFLSRDSLPQYGQPDVLFDNNWFGQRLDTIGNLYTYVENNPANLVDPSGLKGQGHHPGPARQTQRPRKPQVCGFYAWLYAGSGVIPNLAFCIDKDDYDAAVGAGGRVVTCWWECEVETHSTVCGKILTTTEVISGTIGAIGVRLKKSPEEIFVLGQDYKSLLRTLTYKYGSNRAQLLVRAIERSRTVATAKGGVVVTALIEAGISIACGYKCRE